VNFIFSGQKYPSAVFLAGNGGNGFVHNRLFTVTDSGAGTDGAWVTMMFNGDTPEIQRQFPFPYEFTLTFRLNEQGLSIDVTGKNTGGTEMPMGFGWHPYFNMPLTADGDRARCQLQVPTSEYWELAPDLVPSGRRLPVFGRLDMRSSLGVGENLYDDILTGVQHDKNGWSHASLIDQTAHLRVTVSAGPSFREWVIYTPPDRDAVCLEPYTCAGNAFNLQASGVDAGVITLAPGQSWTDAMKITLSSM